MMLFLYGTSDILDFLSYNTVICYLTKVYEILSVQHRVHCCMTNEFESMQRHMGSEKSLKKMKYHIRDQTFFFLLYAI